MRVINHLGTAEAALHIYLDDFLTSLKEEKAIPGCICNVDVCIDV